MIDPLASRIVVGVDGSAVAEEATAFAVHLAGALGGRVTVACAYVHDPRDPGARRTAAQELLGRIAAPYRDEPGLSTCAIPSASPVLAVHDLLRREAATLLVVGTSHVGAVHRAFGGSTAERLVHGAPCPVVVVPAAWRRTFDATPRTIGVGTNGSPESRAAVEHAVELARAWHAQLRVFDVLDLVAQPIGLPFAPAVATMRDTLERDASKALDGIVGELADDVRPQGVLLFGDAAGELAAHSKGLALLVVGSRGHGPLHSVIVGGVSGALIRHAACPVMVVPRVSDGGADAAAQPRAAARPR